MKQKRKFNKSLKVKLIKPYTGQPFYLLKVYPKGSGNTGLIIAKRRYLANWILRLYRDLEQYNSDIPLEVLKVEIGQFMRRRREEKIENLFKKHRPKNSKKVAVFR